jgi:hypothetical protein
VLALMREERIELTLENWLECNMIANDPPSAEMLEVVPERFQQEYIDRLHLWYEYEQKFHEKKSDSSLS